MNLMIFERLIDRKDKRKIRKRTKNNLNGYDYRLSIINDEKGENVDVENKVSFLAIGDSGAGGKNKHMKFRVTEEMNKATGVDLILHLGDVVYLSGSKEGYQDRFIKPFGHWLTDPKNCNYKNMIFNKPLLPIYGNHDYYDFLKSTSILGKVVGKFIGAIGTGSRNGRVFEEAFIVNNESEISTSLPYIPGKQTRIPNRYYWFTQGPCAFFALDSNTLDRVEEVSKEKRKLIKKELKILKKDNQSDQEKLKRFKRLEEKNVLTDKLKDQFEDLLDEVLDQEKKIMLLEKRKKADKDDYDSAQLSWLKRVLQHPDVQGKWKIVYMHHSMYSSESGHTDDGATGGLRENLRKIFIDNNVNLVLSGHSHCFEWPMRAPAFDHVSEEEKARAMKERNICYIVSGGGGKGLRESVFEENRLDKKVRKKQDRFLGVAESKAYTAKFGNEQSQGDFNDVYNYLRIEADEDSLKVIPNGVIDKNDQPFLLKPIVTKVFSETDYGIKTEIKSLTAINVFRDKEPVGDFE